MISSSLGQNKLWNEFLKYSENKLIFIFFFNFTACLILRFGQKGNSDLKYIISLGKKNSQCLLFFIRDSFKMLLLIDIAKLSSASSEISHKDVIINTSKHFDGGTLFQRIENK